MDLALDTALSRGATEAEAYLESAVGLTVKVFDGSVERFSYTETRGIGLRLYIGERQGRAYTSDLSGEAVGRAVGAALAAARVSEKEPDRRLPDRSLLAAGAGGGALLGAELEICAEDLDRVSPGEKIQFAKDLELLAREHDPRVTGVEAAVYGESADEVLLASTAGFRAGFRSTECYGYLVAMAEEDGDSQTGFGLTAGRSFASLDARAAAVEAASMAAGLLGARQVETSRVPVLIDNLSTAEVLAAAGAAASAEAVTKGRSYLEGRLGSAVASPLVNVVDDGSLKGGFGTAPFDGEGVAATRKSVIEGGSLQTYLHNCYTASRMGAASTGNARRPTFRAQVGVAPTNLILEPGSDSPEALRSGMGTGLEVLELQGVHAGLNPVTGEISVGARGRWVVNGRPAHPVREVTIAGTVEDILKGISGIGNDLRFTPLQGGVGTPSILVEGLAVSGK